MNLKKTLTDKKLVANRENAKKSTGPRTQRGKAMTRFNALTHGFYANEVVPRVDGLSQADYDKLLDALRAEFEPVGAAEEDCAQEMANAILLNRRVKSYESAHIRQAATIDDAPIEEHPMLGPARHDLHVLEGAREQVENDRTISRATYEEVLPIVSEPGRETHNGSADTGPNDLTKILVDGAFIKRLRAAIARIQNFIQALLLQDDERGRDYYRSKALLPEPDMKRVIQAENRARNNFESSLRILDHLQTRRKNGERESRELAIASANPATGVQSGLI